MIVKRLGDYDTSFPELFKQKGRDVAILALKVLKYDLVHQFTKTTEYKILTSQNTDQAIFILYRPQLVILLVFSNIMKAYYILLTKTILDS